ncbi:putative alcohol dehydrogenase [Stipitochalara longipes BDJ]|nr:putative alcohol dehydrogenase [Stipitochalara longipes BDJ]
MPPENKAAWLRAPATPLSVGSAPYTPPGPQELVIKNGAVAINPVDWVIPDNRGMMFKWIKDPFILGTDVAGEVVEVGSAVKRFKVGDRVVSQACGVDEAFNDPTKGAFQLYTVLVDHMTSPIPPTLSFEQAAVLPLAVSTAACGLFLKDQLALQLPTIPRPKATGKTVLIWGGATSVGCSAIQLAVAAGYEVITTSSPQNFELMKKLGASQVFDYKSRTVVPDIIRAFKGKTTAGALTMGTGAVEACFDILRQCHGDKFISMATYPMPDPPPKTFVTARTILHFFSKQIEYWVKSKLRGIKLGTIFANTLIGKAVYVDFLGDALKDGSYIAAPEPDIVGHGLEAVNKGFEVSKKGVRARKVVVSLA